MTKSLIQILTFKTLVKAVQPLKLFLTSILWLANRHRGKDKAMTIGKPTYRQGK